MQTTSEHERIWLQPRDCVDEGEDRQWCEDDVWEAPGVEYVRAARLEHLKRALIDVREAIASLDEDVLGFVRQHPSADGDSGYEYPIRDELLATIDRALTQSGNE